MTKKKSFLGLSLIIALVVIICAVVLSLTVGINLGTDIGGGSQIEILLEDKTNIKKDISSVKDAVKESGYEIESIFTEDKGTESYIVVRIANKEVKAEIRDKIKDKLGISLDNISGVLTINGTVTKNTVMWTAVAIICLLLAIFVGGWIRYKLIGGFALLFATLVSLLLAVSMLIITRVRIDFTALIIISLSVALVLFACVYVLERVRENAKYKHNENLEPLEIVKMSVRSTLKPLIIFAALVLVMALVFVCVPISEIALTGAVLVISILAALFSYYFIAMEFYASLYELRAARDKQRLSRNPDVFSKQDKSKLKQAKKDEKLKAKKDKAFNDKFKKKDKDSNPVV